MKRNNTLIVCVVLLITLVTGFVFLVSSCIKDEMPEDDFTLPDNINVSDSGDESNDDRTHAAIFDSSEVMLQLAGNWRSQRHNGYTANDMIISLFADGTWEWSGPLATDHVDGGSFFVERVEDGIYDLSFIVEHSTSSYTEIGLEVDKILQYDPQTDSLSQQDPSTESPGVMITVRYIRVPHAAQDAAPTWNEDGLTSSGTNTQDGFEYRFDALGFSLTLPDSWDGYYELRGEDDGNIQVYFNAMGVFANLFFIGRYDPDFDAYMIETGEYEVIRFFNVQDVRHIEYVMYHRPLDRSLLLATADFSSPGWDLNNELNQEIREKLSRMFNEADTIVAESITVLSNTP